jgi:hypothetical protein
MDKSLEALKSKPKDPNEVLKVLLEQEGLHGWPKQSLIDQASIMIAPALYDDQHHTELELVLVQALEELAKAGQIRTNKQGFLYLA